MLAAFNFIIRNLYGPEQKAKDAAAIDGTHAESELYKDQDQTSLQQTYSFLKKYLDAKNNVPRIVPRIETADLSTKEKIEWERIVARLDTDSN